MKHSITTIMTVLTVVLFSTGCQHGRVILSTVEIPACKNASAGEPSADCTNEKQRIRTEHERKRDAGAKMVEVHDAFYLWGFLPQSIEYKAREHCPGGVSEVYQYSTFMEGLLSEVTLGIYMPRTTRFVCR